MSEGENRSEGMSQEDGEVLFLDPDDGAAGSDGEVVSPASGADARVAELESSLEAARTELNDWKDRYLRKAAEYENARKRQQKEREDLQKFGSEKVLREMIAVLDDMTRAVQAVPADATGAGLELLAQGVQMVHRKFEQSLERFGVQGFSSLGEVFDPTRHEALQQVEDATVPHNTVLREFQRGYLLHDRLLRAALVVVAQGGPAASATPATVSGLENSGEPGETED